MLRRMMVMWSMYHLPGTDSEPADPHIPDMSTQSGLMNIIALGNLLELSQVLDRCSYYTGDGIHWKEKHEIALARQRYRFFQDWFTRTHETRVGGETISALCIFRRCLVEFAAAVIVYKEREWAKAQIWDPLMNCTPAAIRARITSLFESNFPELCAPLQELVAKKAAFLYWTGPPITITPIELDAPVICLTPRLTDFVDFPLYNGYVNRNGTGKGKGKGSENENGKGMGKGMGKENENGNGMVKAKGKENAKGKGKEKETETERGAAAAVDDSLGSGKVVQTKQHGGLAGAISQNGDNGAVAPHAPPDNQNPSQSEGTQAGEHFPSVLDTCSEFTGC
jgi:hypothetical protein